MPLHNIRKKSIGMRALVNPIAIECAPVKASKINNNVNASTGCFLNNNINPNGKAHVMLINKIISRVPADKIIWETPQKSQQVYFIKQFGTNVNLGNIAPSEVIALESLRLGLRSDTFFHFLDKESINRFTN